MSYKKEYFITCLSAYFLSSIINFYPNNSQTNGGGCCNCCCSENNDNKKLVTEEIKNSLKNYISYKTTFFSKGSSENKQLDELIKEVDSSKYPGDIDKIIEKFNMITIGKVQQVNDPSVLIHDVYLHPLNNDISMKKFLVCTYDLIENINDLNENQIEKKISNHEFVLFYYGKDTYVCSVDYDSFNINNFLCRNLFNDYRYPILCKKILNSGGVVLQKIKGINGKIIATKGFFK